MMPRKKTIGRGRMTIRAPLRLLAAVFLPVLLIALADIAFYWPRIYPGVDLHRFSLGGKTRKQVAECLAGLAITITGPGPHGISVSLPISELGIYPESGRVFETAYRQGRNNLGLPDYAARFNIIREGCSLALQYQTDQEALQRSLYFLEEFLNKEPVNAYFRFNDDESRAELVPERPGTLLDQDALRYRLNRILHLPAEPLQLEAPCEMITPAVTAAALREKGIESLMVSFSTPLDPSAVARVHNIGLAVSHLDGLILAPGEFFSLNALIGDTTPEKGYKKAPVIIGGELLPGFGGGICQVASTLYNAALLADLAILERHNHQMTIPYLSPGRDATVEYGAKDLAFRNNTDHHILLSAVIANKKLTIRLLGKAMPVEVEIVTQELAEISPPTWYRYDPGLAPGTEEIDQGSPGYLVEVWKLVYRDGSEVSREKIAIDRYSPHPTVIRQGPAA